MKMFHRDELLGTGPDDLKAAIATVNDEMNAAIRDAVTAEFGFADEFGMTVATAAIKAIPYGLVRDYIARAAPIPAWVDDIAATASTAVVREFGRRAAAHQL